MRFLRWARTEPHFPVWLTAVAILILGGSLVATWLYVDEPPDTEPVRIYLEAVHEIREEFPSRPWWQRALTGELTYENYEAEIFELFERARDVSDPLLDVQYAISLLDFGRGYEALAVLDAVDDPDYEGTLEVLRWLAEPDTAPPGPEFIEEVAWLVEQNDSWWSRKLGAMLADAGLMERASESEIPARLWEKSLWAAGIDWSMLGILALVAWSLRSYRKDPVYGGVASRFGIVSSNAKLLTGLLHMAMVFFLLSVAGYVVIYWFSDDPSYLAFAVVEILSRIAPAILFMVWFFPSWKISVRAMGLELRRLRNHATWFWVCVGMLVTSLGSWLLWVAADWLGGVEPSDFVDVDLAGGGWEVLVFQFFVAGILAPVSEELIFRGVLFRTWAKRYGPWLGACFSSAIFAVIHWYSPLGIASVFMSGMIFAWVTWRTGSLWPALLIHAAGNLIATWSVWWFFSSVAS